MMIGLHKVGSLEELNYYADHAIEKGQRWGIGKEKIGALAMANYLSEPGTASHALGNAVLLNTLGLKNLDNKEELRRAFEAKDTEGNGLLKDQGAGREHTPGWTFVLSDGKELSMARGLADENSSFAKDYDQSRKEARAEILKLMDGLIDPNNSRRRDEKIETAYLVFEHKETRDAGNGPDMQWHDHIFIPNVGVYADGGFGAIETGRLFQAAREQWLGQMYQSELARKMEGKGWNLTMEEKIIENGKKFAPGDEPTYKQATINSGFTKSHIDNFSQRSDAIEAELKKSGIENGTVSQKQKASEATRTKKDDLSYDELKASWGMRAAEYGIEQPTDKRLKELNQAPSWAIQERRDETAAIEAAKGIERLKSLVFKGEKDSIGEGDLINIIAKAYAGLKSPSEMMSMARLQIDSELSQGDAYLDSRSRKLALGLVAIEGPTARTQPVVYVPAACLARESLMSIHAKQIAEDLTERFDIQDGLLENVAASFKEKSGHDLTDQQRGAIRTMTTGRLSIIEGVAGAGKSTIAEVAADAYKSAGFTIIGLTPTGTATKPLQEAISANAHTIDSFLLMEKQLEKVNSKTVFFIDEVGMCGIPKLAEIVKLAKERGAKIIAIGDEKQLAAIYNRGGMGLLKEAAGLYGFIDETRRQDRALVAGKEIGALLREGKSAKVLEMLGKQKALIVCDTMDSVYSTAASMYLKSSQDGTEKSCLLETNKGVEAVNAKVREMRMQAGNLGEKFSAKTENNLTGESEKEFYVGERIVFLENSKGGRNSPIRNENGRTAAVKNGTRATIVGFEKDADGNTMMKAKIGKGDNEKIIEWNCRDYNRFQLGAAITKHKSQGDGFEDVIVVAEGSKVADRSTEYVAFTRHKNIAMMIGTAETLSEWEINAARAPDLRTLWQKLTNQAHREPIERNAIELKGESAVKEWQIAREERQMPGLIAKAEKSHKAVIQAAKSTQQAMKPIIEEQKNVAAVKAVVAEAAKPKQEKKRQFGRSL